MRTLFTFFLAIGTLVSLATASLEDCLNDVCADRSDCVAYPAILDLLYQPLWVKPYNLAIDVNPAAVIRPNSSEDVAAIVRCAADNGVKVQARSGGHSYANFGLGDGAITVDLVNMQQYSMNETTWYATIGAGMTLGDVDTNLHETGRAFAHGVCPGVGIGGHATIGGLGPMSRMWGAALDHIVEVEVVTANGTILRANEDQNSDLFFVSPFPLPPPLFFHFRFQSMPSPDLSMHQALRGAGAGFGIITEFVMRTHPEPGDVVQFSFSFTFGDDPEMLASSYKQWQDLVADPNLDRRFGTELVLTSLGAIITGTFYGTEDEFNATGILDRLPQNGTVTITDWLGSLTAWAENEALYLSNTATQFYSKSLGFRQQDTLEEEDATKLFQYVQDADKGTLLWFIIFDASGGAVADVPTNATAYAHRDKYMFYQSYAVDLFSLSNTTRTFLTDFHDELVGYLPSNTTDRGTYPGYVDLNISGVPQEQYWNENLPALETIKLTWDSDDIFHNPQSVQPSG